MKIKRYYLEIEDYDFVDIADHFKGVESIFHRNRRGVIINLINKFSAGTPILDAGCGTGLILQYLPTGTIGIDLNPRQLKGARKYAPHVFLIQGDLDNIPIRDAVFSTIICTETLEHLSHPKRVLNNFSRIMNKSGLLIGSVPHKFLLWRFRFLSRSRPRFAPFHVEYRISDVLNLLRVFRLVDIMYSTLRLNITFVVSKK